MILLLPITSTGFNTLNVSASTLKSVKTLSSPVIDNTLVTFSSKGFNTVSPLPIIFALLMVLISETL